VFATKTRVSGVNGAKLVTKRQRLESYLRGTLSFRVLFDRSSIRYEGLLIGEDVFDASFVPRTLSRNT
jgi:hypothetical protein